MRAIVLFYVAYFLSSCSSIEDSLCKEDSFYCQDNWESEVYNLSFDKLISVTESYYKVTGAGHTALLDEISGTSGVVDKISSVRRKILYITPVEIVLHLSHSDRIKLCEIDRRERFIRAFKDEQSASLAAMAVCDKKSGELQLR